MPSIINSTTSSGLVTSADNSGSLQLATNNGTTAVTIDTSQNVGIGTASPSSFNSAANRLVVGNGSGNQGLTVFSSTTQYGGIHFADGTSGDDSNRGIVYYNHADNSMQFWTNATERMRISSDGGLLIGTTTNVTNGGFRFFKDYDATGSSSFEVGHINGSQSGNRYAIFLFNGTVIGTITQNGTTAVAYNTTSDYRLKENIAPIQGALAKVQALKPCTYTWKSAPDEIGEGFIAHELAEVCPQAVTGEKDAVNEDGSIKAQSIDTSFLVATLTAAIQELNAKVDAQALEIQALKGVA